MASSWPHLARRGLAFWSLVAGVVVGAAFLGELAVVEHDFQPEGGLFGLPRWVVVCGDRLEREDRDARAMTMAEVESRRAELSAATISQPLVILEPTIGHVPLFAQFGLGVPCGGLVAFLHTGPDAYIEYDARP